MLKDPRSDPSQYLVTYGGVELRASAVVVVGRCAIPSPSDRQSQTCPRRQQHRALMPLIFLSGLLRTAHDTQHRCAMSEVDFPTHPRPRTSQTSYIPHPYTPGALNPQLKPMNPNRQPSCRPTVNRETSSFMPSCESVLYIYLCYLFIYLAIIP